MTWAAGTTRAAEIIRVVGTIRVVETTQAVETIQAGAATQAVEITTHADAVRRRRTKEPVAAVQDLIKDVTTDR